MGAAGVLFAQDANDIETLESECKAGSPQCPAFRRTERVIPPPQKNSMRPSDGRCVFFSESSRKVLVLSVFGFVLCQEFQC